MYMHLIVQSAQCACLETDGTQILEREITKKVPTAAQTLPQPATSLIDTLRKQMAIAYCVGYAIYDLYIFQCFSDQIIVFNQRAFSNGSFIVSKRVRVSCQQVQRIGDIDLLLEYVINFNLPNNFYNNRRSYVKFREHCRLSNFK